MADFYDVHNPWLKPNRVMQPGETWRIHVIESAFVSPGAIHAVPDANCQIAEFVCTRDRDGLTLEPTPATQQLIDDWNQRHIFSTRITFFPWAG